MKNNNNNNNKSTTLHGYKTDHKPIYTQFKEIFDQIHGRPRQKGQVKVSDFVQDALRLAHPEIKKQSEIQKQLGIFSHYLHDDASPKHPRQTDEYAYAHKPDSYHLVIDRLQALIAFCRAADSDEVPYLIKSGHYLPKRVDSHHKKHIIMLVAGEMAYVNGKLIKIEDYCSANQLDTEDISTLQTHFNFFQSSSKLAEDYRLSLIRYCKSNGSDTVTIKKNSILDYGLNEDIGEILSPENFKNMVKGLKDDVEIDDFIKVLTETIKKEQKIIFDFAVNLYKLSVDMPQLSNNLTI